MGGWKACATLVAVLRARLAAASFWSLLVLLELRGKEMIGLAAGSRRGVYLDSDLQSLEPEERRVHDDGATSRQCGSAERQKRGAENWSSACTCAAGRQLVNSAG